MVEFDPPENPRAPEMTREVSDVRSFVVVPSHARCGICAQQGYTRAVQLTKTGVPTGLCAWHNEFEAQLRAELEAEGKNKTLTAKDRESAKARIAARMRGAAA